MTKEEIIAAADKLEKELKELHAESLSLDAQIKMLSKYDRSKYDEMMHQIHRLEQALNARIASWTIRCDALAKEAHNYREAA